MNPSLPKISVITPSFNQGRYIRETIESVLRQGYPNFEHIVMDGGSTDETVSILKSYPHLIWESAPDRGQTHALNKALHKAQGEIIAWINSDDWYADGVFHEVAEQLKSVPLMVGACELRDKDNQPMYQVPNIERGWFDLVKYWNPYSIPTQPSIFFRRDLLNSIRRPDGEWLDEELYYCMDFDLWLRMMKRAPLSVRSPRVFSYYRMTEDNKTGGESEGMSYAEPEMSRIFRRYCDMDLPIECAVSFVIPASEDSPALRATLDTILLQSVADFEVVLVGYGNLGSQAKALKKLVRELNARQKGRDQCCWIRFLTSEATSPEGAVTSIVSALKGSLVTISAPGSRCGPEFIRDQINLFASDRIGVALPLSSNFGVRKHFESLEHLGINALFSSPSLPLIVSARRVCLLELGGFLAATNSTLAVRQLLVRALSKGWQISLKNNLVIVPPESFTGEVPPNQDQINAVLISQLHREQQTEPFHGVRAAFGASISFADETVTQCESLLRTSPYS